jgi:hypothetical protein
LRRPRAASLPVIRARRASVIRRHRSVLQCLLWLLGAFGGKTDMAFCVAHVCF